MKQVLLVMFFAFAGVNLFAQSFETSTADAPKWYFIQVKGVDADDAGKVITEIDGNKVVGQPIADGWTNKTKQLWRIEAASSTRYEIINKYSGKKLDVYYDAVLGERIVSVNETPSTQWIITDGISGHYLLRIDTPPTGGTSGAAFLTQGSEELHSALYCTRNGVGGDNAQFQFVSIDAPLISIGDEKIWFSIFSAKNSLAGKCLTETGTLTDARISLLDFTAGDRRQQWKIINNPASSGFVNFVNRETGRKISTEPVNDIYNYIQYAETETVGWQIDSLGSYQYKISTGAAGVEKYWNAVTAGNAQDSYEKDNVLNTGFAWQFRLAGEGGGTSIRETPALDPWRVFVQNRRICVEGTGDYRIYTIQGTRIRKDGELPAGIYLVTVKNTTIKVLVK